MRSIRVREPFLSVLMIGTVVLSVQPSASARFEGPINRVFLDRTHLVIIVPTNEQPEEQNTAIHIYAGRVRELVLPKETPIMTDREALKADLSNKSLMLYGTPSGNLWLAKHMGELPVWITPSAIKADKIYEGETLRFISTWPHPQNPARGIVIYTAQRAEDVVGINSIHHGPTDFVIAKVEVIIASGGYRKTNGQWQLPKEDSSRVSLVDARDDLSFFIETVKSVHPFPLARVDPKKALATMQQSYAALDEAADKEGYVSKADLAITTARLAAMLEDGHTFCQLTPDLIDRQDASQKMLPFRLAYDQGQIRVGQTAEDLRRLRGKQLLKINGQDTVQTIGSILEVISGERQAFRVNRFVHQQRTYWALLSPISQPEVTIVVTDSDGKTESLSVELISLADYDKLVGPTKRAEKDAVTFHHKGKTCYWRYNSFIHSEGERKKITSLFEKLKARRVNNLVIDLRYNGGGNSTISDHILSYLTARPFRQFSRVDIRYSEQLLAAGGGSGLTRAECGWTVATRSDPKLPEEREARFEGNVFVLTGPGTFSSAAGFATIVKDYQIATIIGEETGGLRQSYGDILNFSMPRSGIGFGVSYKCFYAPIPKPGDDIQGTVPDIAPDDKALAAFADNNDPLVSFVLDMVENQRIPAR